MTSRSFDGEYIARIIQKLGFRAVRGSSSRGAVGALIGMRQQLEQGHGVVFTIDGPRGPRYVAKPGPVLLAKKTGIPISCFYVAVKRAWILNSWDQMIIPKPFSQAVIYGSGPMYVPADATDEQMTAFHQQMQETLERCRLGAEKQLAEWQLSRKQTTATACDPDLAWKQKQHEFWQRPDAVGSGESCWSWEQGPKEPAEAQRNSGPAIDRRALALLLASLASPSATLPNPLTFRCQYRPAPEFQEACKNEASGLLQFPDGPGFPAARTPAWMRGKQSCGRGCAIALKP